MGSSGVGCVYPWLSNRNQCTTITRNDSIDGIRSYFSWKYILPYYYTKKTAAEKKCKNPCITTKIFIQSLPTVDNSYGFSMTNLEFNPAVIIERKERSYGFFNFLVDAGSSLGLWLGLSFISLIDLIPLMIAQVRKYVGNSIYS